MIHNPLHRVAKMLVEIAACDPRADVANIPLSKAFKRLKKVEAVYWEGRVWPVRGMSIPRGLLRREGFMPWCIWSDRLGMVIGRGHTLERCAMAALKHLRSGQYRPQ